MTSKPEMFTANAELLTPNPWNTNAVSPVNEQKLEASLTRFGLFKPIIVREVGGKYQILGGEHRWRTAVRLGHETVPVVNLGVISDKRAKEIGLADNGRYGEDDTLGLSALLRDLGIDAVAEFLPYTDGELDSILAASDISLDDLDKIEDVTLADLENKPAPAVTTQVMRFKIPVEDVAWVTTLIEREMKSGGFTKEDALANAGNAFVSILAKFKNTL